MRKLLVCCFVVLFHGFLSAEKRQTDPSDFNLSVEVKDVTPIIGNTCEIEAVIGNVLYGLGNNMGQGCPLSVGVYDHVRGTKHGFDFLLYDIKKRKTAIKSFSIVGEHLLPVPVIKASGASARQSAPPASDQTPATDRVSRTPKAAQCNLPPASDQRSIATSEQQADDGDAAAQCGLGFLYEKGDGVPQNYAQAAAWYRKSAEQGDAEAQYKLGGLYEAGYGVPQDYAQTAIWYRKAAEQGYAMAQFDLGLLYDEGKGVPQNYAEAAVWYRKSAEQGDLKAQWSLGSLYHEGLGVPHDDVEAYFWYDLAEAAASGLGLVPQAAEQINKDRDEAASHLTPADLSREQERARKWFEAHQAKPQ